ncbi:hypothetical protein EQ845_16750 [Pseudomonas putida]|uniref:hypothetical protein n=1 Tax=Pseudomonas putida TaxID=303 RepID=UPI00117BBDB8|nr:hypothetical protein [Pseudomonas putida]TRO33897.1 hypothetical protein EQ845_16750 [Pseudomonas putida]
MDYYVDHSSSTGPAYIQAMAGQLWGEQVGDNFFFSSGSYDALPRLTRWSNPNQVVVVKESVVKNFSAVRREICESPSTQDVTKINLLSSRLDYIYCNDAAALIDPSQSRVALSGVVDAIEDLIDASDYAALDDLLFSVEPTRLRPITNVAFLRTAFQAKDKLKNWKLLYQVVYAHLANSGQDPNRALRGLSAPRASSFA